MSKKLLKVISIGIGVSLLLALLGNFAFAAQKELTPYEWNRLPDEEKLEYKTIVIRDWIWTRAWMEKETYTKFDEITHTGKFQTAQSLYNKAMFELYNPNVKVVGIDFRPWGKLGFQNIVSGIAGGTGPIMFPVLHGGGPEMWIERGMAADITDLVKDWDQAPYIMSSPIKNVWDLTWKDGRCYGIPDPSYLIVRAEGPFFRKDWFREAGLFNEEGKPGPPTEWSWEDFRSIARKLTDEKKKRWGTTSDLRKSNKNSFQDILPWFSFGNSPYTFTVPDKSGKYTWKFNTTPQAIEVFQFFRDMIWEDKSVLVGVELIPVTQFLAGRVGIHQDGYAANYGRSLYDPYILSATTPLPEIVGGVLPRKGPYGMKRGVLINDPYAFDPTLNEEQLKAAFEWMDWNSVGMGKTIALKSVLDRLPLSNKGFYPWSQLDENSYLKIRNLPPGFPPMNSVLPAEYLEMATKILNIPQVPGETLYSGIQGLVDYPLAEELDILFSLKQVLATNPDVDVEEEVKKTADLLNTTVYNVKMENDIEKLEKYYTDLDNFYEEYYPDWYNSKEYKDLFEQYYKCW